MADGFLPLPAAKPTAGKPAPSLGTQNNGFLPLTPLPKGSQVPSGWHVTGHAGGITGFFQHLGGDVKDTVAGFPQGIVNTVEHPIGTAKAIGHSYAQTYGPLVHGHVNAFLHQLYGHPLGPILDVATIATLGGAGAARGANLLARARGVAAVTARDARIATARELTVPSFAKAAAKQGISQDTTSVLAAGSKPAEKVLVRTASRNPVIRGRQAAVNAGLNKLPAETPVFGSIARGTKALDRNAGAAANRVGLDSAQQLQNARIPFAKAYGRLNTVRQVAFHLIANGVHDPTMLADYWRAQKLAGHDVSDAAIQTIEHPQVQELVRNYQSDPKLANALAEGEKASAVLEKARLDRGLISQQTAAERPYFMLRTLHGAQHEVDANGHIQQIIDQPGKSIPEIAQGLAEQGHHQPFYLPMKANVNEAWRGGAPMRVFTKATLVPKNPIKRLSGTLLQKGMLSFHDSLSPEFLSTAKYAQRADLHDALMQHAVRLSSKEPLPAGWEFLKSKTGEHIAHTDQIRAEFEQHTGKSLREMDRSPFEFPKDFFTTTKASDPAIATDHVGGRLIVPSQAADALRIETRRMGALGRFLYSKPTVAWKHLVLGLRPAFGVNLTIGNHVLAMSQAPSIARFLGSYLNQLPGHLQSRLLGAKLSRETLARVFPEQLYGSFGHQEGYGAGSIRNVGKAAYQGVMPATIGIENFLRRALLESWARDEPAVRTAMRANGGDLNAALVKVHAEHPAVTQEISRRTDAAIGNYRNYSQLEQNVKQAIPFYGWQRHIARSTGRVLGEFPHRANVATKIGQQGFATQDQNLGPLPHYMGGSIGLAHLPGILGPMQAGRTALLQTHQWNPFNSAVDLSSLLTALVHGQAGAHSDVLAGGLNPFVQGAIEEITGRSLLSGSKIKNSGNLGLLGNLIVRSAQAVPQARLAAAAAGWAPKTKPTALNQNDFRTLLADWLGAPVKKTNLLAAHRLANLEGKPPR